MFRNCQATGGNQTQKFELIGDWPIQEICIMILSFKKFQDYREIFRDIERKNEELWSDLKTEQIQCKLQTEEKNRKEKLLNKVSRLENSINLQSE